MRKTPRLWIEKYPSIRKMYETITSPRRMGSPGTAEIYIHGVRRFIQFLGLEDPEEALAKIRSGEIDALRQIDRYIDYALTKNAHKTVRNYVFGVKKWLETNGVLLEWRKIEMPTATEVYERDKAPSKEELKMLLHHARSARDRAVILILASSGLRIGTLLSLTVGDVNFDYPDVARINVWRKKGRKFTSRKLGGGGRFYCTFITPEAKQALQQYLKEREAKGEKITAESPLITDAYCTGKFITVEDWQRVYYRILRAAGLDKKSRRWYMLHIHSLRKFFRSNCVGVDPSYREFWMGHKGGYLDESYFRAEEPRHLAEYRKAIPYLTVYRAEADESWKMAIKAIAMMQNLPEEKLRALEEILARSKVMDEAIREFRKLQEQPNNGREFRVVQGEEALLKHLREGWELMKELNHDKYLLKKIQGGSQSLSTEY